MNSKDLRNLAEAYQNIQEEPRRARRRRPTKSVEDLKREIDARNPTQAGPKTGQRVPGAAPKLEVKPVPDPLPTNVQPPAPKPQFGPGSTNTGQSFPKPPRVPRDAGAFARQRLMAKPPVAPVVRPNLLSKVRGGPASTALNIATGAALDKYAVQPVAKAGGDALARTILDLTGKGDRARQVNPELYGMSGPNLTPEIVKGVQQRSKLAQQSAETQAASQPKPEQTGEKSAAANAEKQEVAKANAQRRRAAAADFDKTFAAAREKGEKTFTWRGKSYNTKLK